MTGYEVITVLNYIFIKDDQNHPRLQSGGISI